MANRLAGETSPYLLQHADNPVDWYPWGEEALERARREDKPVLLSIGYSACHWCHVMAHESFENDQTASLMNELFVSIKVDREERPDLDTIYMKAVQSITGSGGWPLTVFLTPEGKPFFGGTYFPPRDLPSRPGFPRVLKAAADAYRNRRGEVDQAVKQIADVLAADARAPVSVEPLVADILRSASALLTRGFDAVNGGFGGAPKFPQPMALEYLLRYFHRTGDPSIIQMVEFTLEKMASGGIYDQLGGGFHRYATDIAWQVPHFEKMLYDNALVGRVYLHAYLATGKSFFRSVAQDTLGYVLRDMTGPHGGFYCSEDADSDGVEGKYYVWIPEEITEVLGNEAGRGFCDYYGVTRQGNFEGQNILHVVGQGGQQAPEEIGRARGLMLERRRQRARPGRDEKMLASWNGMMLSTLAEAACALGREDYLAAAVANGAFLVTSMLVDGMSLKHSFKDGRTGAEGYLEDYALVIEGLLGLHEATFSGRWITQAVALAEAMVERFWDEERGALYDSSGEQRDLFLRPRSVFDGAFPSGGSAATLVLLRLARLAGSDRFQSVAVKSLRSMREAMTRQPLGFGNWLCGLDFYLSRPKEIAIIGPRESASERNLVRTIYSMWLPNKVVAALDPDDVESARGLRLLEGKQPVNGQPTVYVCQDYACQAPVTDAPALEALLRKG